MVRHIVLWNLQDQAEGNSKATNGALIKEGLEGLLGKIDGMTRAEVAVGTNPEGYDLCLLSEFTSQEALDAYQKNPLHDKVRQFVRKVISSRVVFDSPM